MAVLLRIVIFDQSKLTFIFINNLIHGYNIVYFSLLLIRIETIASKAGLSTHFPPIKYCSDNALMISWAGLERLNARIPIHRHVWDLDFKSTWSLEDLNENPVI